MPVVAEVPEILVGTGTITRPGHARLAADADASGNWDRISPLA